MPHGFDFPNGIALAIPNPCGNIGVLGAVPLGEGVATNEVGAQGETSPY